MAERLGEAVLQLDVDQRPLERGLHQAELKTAAAVAVMQAQLNSLHAGVATQIAALAPAITTGLTRPMQEFGAATALTAKQLEMARAEVAAMRAMQGVGNLPQLPQGQPIERERVMVEHGGGGVAPPVYGVRGSKQAGSVMNPVTVVIEAASRAGLSHGMAAAMGEAAGAAPQSEKAAPVVIEKGQLFDASDLVPIQNAVVRGIEAARIPAQLPAPAQDTHAATEVLTRVWRALKDERGSIQVGGGGRQEWERAIAAAGTTLYHGTPRSPLDLGTAGLQSGRTAENIGNRWIKMQDEWEREVALIRREWADQIREMRAAGHSEWRRLAAEGPPLPASPHRNLYATPDMEMARGYTGELGYLYRIRQAERFGFAKDRYDPRQYLSPQNVPRQELQLLPQTFITIRDSILREMSKGPAGSIIRRLEKGGSFTDDPRTDMRITSQLQGAELYAGLHRAHRRLSRPTWEEEMEAQHEAMPGEAGIHPFHEMGHKLRRLKEWVTEIGRFVSDETGSLTFGGNKLERDRERAINNWIAEHGRAGLPGETRTREQDRNDAIAALEQRGRMPGGESTAFGKALRALGEAEAKDRRVARQQEHREEVDFRLESQRKQEWFLTQQQERREHQNRNPKRTIQEANELSQEQIDDERRRTAQRLRWLRQRAAEGLRDETGSISFGRPLPRGERRQVEDEEGGDLGYVWRARRENRGVKRGPRYYAVPPGASALDWIGPYSSGESATQALVHRAQEHSESPLASFFRRLHHEQEGALHLYSYKGRPFSEEPPNWERMTRPLWQRIYDGLIGSWRRFITDERGSLDVSGFGKLAERLFAREMGDKTSKPLSMRERLEAQEYLGRGKLPTNEEIMRAHFGEARRGEGGESDVRRSFSDLEKMRKEALNLYAEALGIPSPEKHKTKASLIGALPDREPTLEELWAAMHRAEGKGEGPAGLRQPGGFYRPLREREATTYRQELGLEEILGPGDDRSGFEQFADRVGMGPDQPRRRGRAYIGSAGIGPFRMRLGPGGGGGHDDRPPLAKVLWGGSPPGGILGSAYRAMPAIGLASLAGLGFERVPFTIGSVLGSGAAALGGAGLLAGGGLARMGVGMGSDLAVTGSTIKDTQALSQGYANLDQAVKLYGKGSNQAARAQKELNIQMEALAGGGKDKRGVEAEAGLAKRTTALNHFWDRATQGARVAAVHVLDQVVHLGATYVPLVAQAAERNLGIINKNIRPLFGWLEGPQGKGIFKDLENQFAHQLPTTIHAFTQALEFVVKTLDTASHYGGGFVKSLDQFFTKWNSPAHFSIWQKEIGKLVEDFHLWWHFIRLVGADLHELFAKDAGLGKALIGTFSQMLENVKRYMESTKGDEKIRNIFLAHKEEVIALITLLPKLLDPLGKIYLTVAPPLIKAFTAIAEAVAKVLTALEELSPAFSWLIGGAFILQKMGMLGKTITALGDAFGVASFKAKLFGAANTKVAESEAAATAGGAAETAVLTSTRTSTSTGPGVLPTIEKSKGLLTGVGEKALRGAGLAAAAGFGVHMIGDLVGVKGPANDILSVTAAGAAFGSQFGGPWGAAAGGLIAGGIGLAVELFNHKAKEYGSRFGKGFVAPLKEALGSEVAQQQEKQLHHQRDLGRKAADELKKLRKEEAGELSEHSADPNEQRRIKGVYAPLIQRAFNKEFTAELREGMAAAETLKKAFATTSHPTTSGFIASVRHDLRSMSGEAQQSAAAAMVRYAAGLEKGGKLPHGAVKKILTALENDFTGFKQYMEGHGQDAAQAVAESFKLEKAQHNLTEALKKMKKEWGLYNLSDEVNGKNLVHNLGVSMADFRKIAASNTGKTRDEALHHLKELHDKAGSLFDGMLHHFTSSLKGMGPALKAHLPAAVKVAQTEMGKLTSSISNAVEGGVLGTEKGAELIAEALNAQIKAFGGKEVPVPVLKVVGAVNLVAQQAANKVSTLFGSGKAGGGVIQFGTPGERGHDNIPMTFGGQDIVVGSGEVGAVFNADQQHALNARLSDVGGLDGFFSQPWRPHHMAKGGFVPGLGGEKAGVATVVSDLIRHYPGLAITSTTGGEHAPHSYHYLHEAVDVAGSYDTMLKAAAWVGNKWGRSLVEGIHNPDLSIKGGHHVPPSFWGSTTWAGHANHIHLAVLGGRPVPGGLGGDLGLEGWKDIHAPHVQGHGALPTLMNTGLHRVAHQANIRGRTAASEAGPMEGGAGGSPVAGSGAGHYSKGDLERLWMNAGGRPESAHIAAAIALAESGGNPNALNHNTNGSIDRGLWQINSVHGRQSTTNVSANVRAAIAISNNGRNWHPWVTYNKGAYRRYMARGGLLGFAGGGTTGKNYRSTRPKGAHGVHKPKKTPHLNLIGLRSNIEDLPGMEGIGKAIAPEEERYNTLNQEMGLLEGFLSNPSSLLPSDMHLLEPTLKAGQTMVPFETVTKAEISNQNFIQKGGQREKEDPQLVQQAALLSYIGGLEDHKILTPEQSAIIHSVLRSKKGTQVGLAFPPHYGILYAEQQTLEQEKLWQEVLEGQLRAQKKRAISLMKKAEARRARLQKMLRLAYGRFKRMKDRANAIKLAGARRRLSTAVFNSHVRSELQDAEEHRGAIKEALSAETELAPVDQQPELIRGLRHQDHAVGKFIQHLGNMTISGSVSSAREHLLLEEIRQQQIPVGEEMRDLGGSSSTIGTGGSIGKLTKQINALDSASVQLDEKIRTAATLIPTIAASISGIKDGLAASAERLPPVPESGSPEKPQDSELASLYKQQRDEARLETAVHMAQYKVLSKLPPFGGHFALGGVVPGPLGAARTVVAHGGESITPPGQASVIQVIVQDGAVNADRIKVLANGEAKRVQRTTSRNAGRPLPGAGGGL